MSHKKMRIKKNQFEHENWANQFIVAGIDEVGRGCLAGPVVAAAAILPLKKTRSFLRDSKLLSEKERLEAYSWIIKHCFLGIGIIDNRIIDSINIYQANKIAMRRAFMNLMASYRGTLPLGAILIDAVPLAFTHSCYASIPVHAYPKGETWSSSIAAASIVAKVTRDHIMQKLHTVFPGYALNEHKGYATKAHQDALAGQTHSIIHRLSFLNNPAYSPQKDDFHAQNSLF